MVDNEFSNALLAIVEKVAADDEQAQAMHDLYDLFNEYHNNFGTRCIEFLNADHLLKMTQIIHLYFLRNFLKIIN